jgi:hypothetical protein
MPKQLIYGISCTLRGDGAVRVVKQVLRQIRDRYPNDFVRLSARVLRIEPLTRRDRGESASEGVVGRWCGRTFEEVYRDTDFVSLPEDIRMKFDEWHSGIVKLAEDQARDKFMGIVAHEFGHACTRFVDIVRRCAPEDEWASEAAADWYAYKWGFGRYIAICRRTRAWLHHGPAPGSWIEIQHAAGQWVRHTLSRKFVFKSESVNEPSGS